MAKKTEQPKRQAPRFKIGQKAMHVYTFGDVTIVRDVSSEQDGTLYEIRDRHGCEFVAADCELEPLPDPRERRHRHAQHDRHLSSGF